MPTWTDLLLQRAETTPNKVAFRFLTDGGVSESAITFAELDRRSRAIAVAIRDRMPTGERVLLLAPPGIDYIAGLFGCFYAGVIAVPAYPPQFNRPWSRIVGLAADCTARAALTVPGAPRGDASVLGPEGLWLSTDEGDAEQWKHPGIHGGDVAFLQYTSGSTSDPKGVILSHDNLLANSESIKRAMGNTEDSVGVSWLPPYHDMGLIGAILQAAYGGHECVMMSPLTFLRKPIRWLQALSRHRGTYAGAPNFAYELCVKRTTEEQRAELDLSSWRTAYNGAERVRRETLEAFTKAFAVSKLRSTAVSPCYGLAEATLCISFKKLGSDFIDMTPADEVERAKQKGQPPATYVGCGPIVHGVEVRIVDPETRRALPAGEVGEVWAHGDNVGLGYWNRPEASEATFRAEIEGEPGKTYLRTGDLGFLGTGPDPELTINGRIKDLIILLGRNHYPEDIERTAVAAHPALRASCGAAFSVDEDGAERLVLVYDAESDVKWEIEEVTAKVRDAIAERHEVQLHALALVKSGAVPKTSSGKVRRQHTKKLYLAGELNVLGASKLRTTATAVAPSAPGGTSAEAALPTGRAAQLAVQVAQLMAEVLEVQSVSPDDDFFVLGGHSLLATQLVSRIRAAAGIEVPLHFLFEAPTPARLATRLERLTQLGDVVPLVRGEPGADAPLTHSQERMWFLHQLAPESTAYNIAGGLILTGPLNVDALEKSLREVTRRHEVLRCVYTVRDGRPVMVARPPEAWSLERVDVSSTPGPEAEKEARRLASELAQRPFDLAVHIPLRSMLLRMGPEHAILALSVHHIAADGWSMTIIIREMLAIYAAQVSGAASPLPEPGFQYGDYARWQRKLLDGEALKPQAEFWKKQLAALPDFVSFPTDRPRPTEQSFRGAMETFDLPESLFHGIRELAQKSGVTPFMVLLAAFDVLFSRHTQQTDLPVGVPIANRNWLASEQFVGTLVNTLVMRANLAGDPTFNELLGRVRDTALAAYANQDFPFERLVELVQAKRARGQSPLFQVMFDMQRVEVPSTTVAGLAVTIERAHRAAAQFDLSVSIIETGSGHLGSVEYATALYDAASIRRLTTQYVTILESIVVDPTQKLSAISLLGPGERQTVLETWNATDVPFDPKAFVHRQFRRQAESHPGGTAIRFEGRSMTYRELDEASDRLAWQLVDAGVGEGTLVGICADRSPAMVAALLATWKVGAAYVPIDPAYPEARVTMILEDAQPRALFTQATLAPLYARVQGVAVLTIDDAFAAPAAGGRTGGPPDQDITPEATAYVLFTSGSTGRPKGVQVPHRALVNFLGAMRKSPGMTRQDRLMAVTTISFDISGLELYLPLVCGASIELMSQPVAADPSLLRAQLETLEPTILQATPSTWRMLMDAGYAGSKSLKGLVGGEALPQDLAVTLVGKLESLWNMYGPTETTIWSTCHRIGDDGRITIGRPIDNTQIYILDDALNPMPVGVPGELWIGGEGVAKGYLGRPDLTRDRFVEDPFARKPGARMYRTGDSASWAADGTLDYLGRLDGQVKVRGHRIELGEIEVALRKHPSVAEVAVSVYTRNAGDQRLVAYLVVAPGASIVNSELQAHLRAQLPEYMVPGIYVGIAALPLTPNGKLDRKALPPPMDLVSEQTERGRPPQGQIEEGLARIWQETLGVSRIGASDDFFVMGGHSILAVKLFAKIREELGADLPLRVLFEAPTIEAMAKLVSAGGTAASSQGVVAIQPRGDKKPIFWVDALGVGGGGLLRYRRLAQLLGNDQPSYGICEPSDQQPSVEAWADYNIRAMKSVQPTGPYFLAGYCLGGNLAYAMADRLRALGDDVAMVALLEASAHTVKSRGNGSGLDYARTIMKTTSAFAVHVARLDTDDKVSMARREGSRIAKMVASRLGLMEQPQQMEGDFELAVDIRHYDPRQLEVARHHWQLLERYRSPQYPGEVHLFRVPRKGLLPRLPALGWELLARTVTVDVVDGPHTEMLDQPQVQSLAAKFSVRVQQAQIRCGSSSSAANRTATAAP